MIGGCALNHGLEKVCARGKGLCAKVWDVHAWWLCTVRDSTLLNALNGGHILPFAKQRPDYVVVSIPPAQAPVKACTSVQ